MKKTLIVTVLLITAMLISSCSLVKDAETEGNGIVRSEPNASVTEKAKNEPETEQTSEITTELPSTETETETPGKIRVEAVTLSTYSLNLKVGEKETPWVTLSPDNATDKGELWESSDTSVATVNSWGEVTAVGTGTCTVTFTSADNSSVKAEVKVTVQKAVAEISTVNNCTYIDGILIANKTYPLPADYNPGEDATAVNALYTMFAAAQKDGITLFVKSGFRRYIDQQIIYNDYVSRDGQESADRYSARPGHSEHQTGLAFDLNLVEDSFAGTPEAIWLENNCYKYGFIIRYPSGKESVTGYLYEPWHVRYLGVDTATAVYNSGKCLEEYLGITSKYPN